jgi:hypothetical protein
MTMYTSTTLLPSTITANSSFSYTSRPFFGLGLGLAALGWVGGAIDAHIVTQEHEPLPVTGSNP